MGVAVSAGLQSLKNLQAEKILTIRLRLERQGHRHRLSGYVVPFVKQVQDDSRRTVLRGVLYSAC